MKRIAIAGNIICDIIKTIDGYPGEGMLENISSITRAVGGCVSNTAISLAKMKGNVEVSAYGRIGKDEYGNFVREKYAENSVDSSNIKIDTAATSFTDVFTVKSTGNRTFYQFRGANDNFCIDDVDFADLDCDIFHIGYILLLASMDEVDSDGVTNMAKLLKKVQERGIKTSVDVVSENSDRFERIVPPALKYCNYAILNEIESGRAVGLNPRNSDGSISEEKIKEILRRFMKLGVKDRAVIHAIEGGYAMDSEGKYTHVPAYTLPKGYIKGSVGAGDAFCAGALYALVNEYDDEKMLRYANASACCNLSHINSIDGMRPEREIWELDAILRGE